MGERPGHWAPSHCLGCLSQPPPRSPIALLWLSRWTIGTIAIGAGVLWVVDQILLKYYDFQQRKKKRAARAAKAKASKAE